MSKSITHAAVAPHRISLERVRSEMAKADLNRVETRDYRADVGRAIQRAVLLAGMSQKEVAADIGCDVAQLSRWIAGTETPQFARLFALEKLREPLCVTLAQMSGAVVRVRIEFPQSA